MSLEPYSKLTATDGRGAKVKRQWVPDNWSCDEEAPPSKPSCSGSSNEQSRLILLFIKCQVKTFQKADTPAWDVSKLDFYRSYTLGATGVIDSTVSGTEEFTLHQTISLIIPSDQTYLPVLIINTLCKNTRNG